HVSVEGKEILKGLSLQVKKGEIHALMGPNGSGKSTFANTLMGHPKYDVTSGEMLFRGQNLLEMETDERARAGLFMAFQYPVAIPGLTFSSFLRAALNARLAPSGGEDGNMPKKKGIAPKEFRELLREKMSLLKVDEKFASRYLNDGFSGGENGNMPKKKGIAPKEFRELLREKMSLLKVDEKFASRYLNDGFSGGE